MAISASPEAADAMKGLIASQEGSGGFMELIKKLIKS
jgi:hypothetical protein